MATDAMAPFITIDSTGLGRISAMYTISMLRNDRKYKYMFQNTKG